jgi:hypothetical protein
MIRRPRTYAFDRFFAISMLAFAGCRHVPDEQPVRQAIADPLGVYRIESAWRNDGGPWRCCPANWKQPMP